MSKLRPRAARRVTIKDVAQAAGVSVTTVSNALNGRNEAMAKDTLLRIQETISNLGYHPSSVARSLVTSHTATIGLIVSEIDTLLFLQALNHIEAVARNADYNILLCTASNVDDERQVVDLLLEKQVDGIIFMCNSNYIEHDFLTDLPLTAPPIVLINRTSTLDKYDQINWDDAKGMVTIIDYLIGLGHQRIAHLYGPQERRSTRERLKGYRLALAKYDLADCPAYLHPGDYLTGTSELWEASTQELLALSCPPTAIIAANDVVATTIMRTIQQVGLNIPRDITVVGIDDHPFCTYLNPTLTSLQLPVVQAGRLAIEMLLARIKGERTTIEHILLPCALISRESSEAVLSPNGQSKATKPLF